MGIGNCYNNIYWSDSMVRKIKKRMASSIIHKEVKNWKRIDNLLELTKYQYETAFTNVYWAVGLFVAMLILLMELGNQQKIGWIAWMYIIVIIICGIGFWWAIVKIRGAQKQADEDIEYLYRKKDGQRV